MNQKPNTREDGLHLAVPAMQRQWTRRGRGMNIYIASSWKNQHAVEMMTDFLEARGYEVACFVRHSAQERDFPDFEEWVNTDRAMTCFVYDTNGATKSDLVVYIGPSGTDAWAEVGAAWALDVPVIGLWAKGEQAGLMRHMVQRWFTDYKKLIDEVETLLARKDPMT